MTLSAYENSAFGAIKLLFDLKKVRVTPTTLKNRLLQEPTFPSLASLSNILTDLNVFNAPLVINPRQLGKIQLPAIAHLENGIVGFVVINKVDVENNQIEWYHEGLGTVKESITDFTNKWQGVVLITKPNEKSEEENFEINHQLENIKKFRMPFIFASLIAIIGYFLFINSNLIPYSQIRSFYGISTIKILGLFFSVLLIKYIISPEISIEEHNSETVKIKNKFVKSLNLETRKILGWLTWAEIGLIYFTLGLTYFLVLGANSNSFIFLKWMNYATLPYIFWSIYYQSVVIRKLCFICLGATTLLLTEFYFLFNIPHSFDVITPLPIDTILIIFLLVITGWVFIRNHLFASISNEDIYNSFEKTKFSKEYVQTFFGGNKTLNPFFEKMQTVNIGSPEAANTILAVLNPNSSLSEVKFEKLMKLVTINPIICCKIILVPDSPEDTKGINVINNILNLPDEQRFEALSNWYKFNDLKKCNFKNELLASNKLPISIDENMSWVILARLPLISPTIYLNNSILPSIYDIKEVPKLLRVINSKF